MSPSPRFLIPCNCLPRPPLRKRELLGSAEARCLESLFKTLANGTRLRILHALVRGREMCVSEISAAVGMTPQAVSNQLQRLADWGILGSRRDGLQVRYRIVDPCVVALLDKGLCLAEDSAKRAP